MSASAWDWDFIRACRDGEADLSKEPPLSKAERQHRTYLRIIAKDPDYYTRRRRAERKARRQAKETKMCKKNIGNES
ncbi:hypothetical protein [Bifidobacterium bombi]|uniref:Uncharacterized protein n=1 Tax=Bifidobacterium bombi DSM 19703 TaxID=1341695 RepID=A0A080N3D5_9BIFI|nr:hypothetical protein [Bifidobacterium bombi]KFF31663.1 hypothetical protein BBOMB_1050 [Bifidobacterium bombi DSM 19703]